MKSKSVNKNIIQWDITDVYKSDSSTGSPSTVYLLHIITHVNEGEIVHITQIYPSEVPHDLQNELDQIDGYDGSELIIIATALYSGLEGNVRDTRTSFKLPAIPGQGGFCILVLEDPNPNGRPRKLKRTTNAVTTLKPGGKFRLKPLGGKLKNH